MNNFLPDVAFYLRADGCILPNQDGERPGIFHRRNSPQESHGMLLMEDEEKDARKWDHGDQTGRQSTVIRAQPWTWKTSHTWLKCYCFCFVNRASLQSCLSLIL